MSFGASHARGLPPERNEKDLESVKAIIQKCQTTIGATRVRFLCSTSVPVPITVGIVKHLIILPEPLLHEGDEEVLTSAIGHELVHVARRDYLVNLIYEFIYLPLSFHPAAALVRRRIKQTRELCCDEWVATKLLRPDIYARSLVRLVGSAPIARRLGANTTIGINESDILEVRIMSLLKTSKLTARSRRLLLVAAALLLATPCIAATSFALSFDIDRREPDPLRQQQSVKRERQAQAREREELKRAEQELKDQIRVAPESKRGEIEGRLREVQRALEEHEKLLRGYAELRSVDEEKLLKAQAALVELEKKRPVNEAAVREARQQLAQLEKEYAEARRYGQLLEETRRAEREAEEQQARIQGEKQKEEKLKWKDRELEERAKTEERELEQRAKIEEKELKERRKVEERLGFAEMYEMKRRKDVEGQGRQERAWQAELARGATLSMDRAIQIATSQVPGKVLACNLGRDGDKIFYHVVIIGGDGDKSTTTYVWVSATDGQILKTEKEERKEEESAIEPGQRAPIHGGVLNGKASSLPLPAYPAIARQAHASGAVTVQ